MTFSDLRAIRLGLGLTRGQLAVALGVARTAVKHWETAGTVPTLAEWAVLGLVSRRQGCWNLLSVIDVHSGVVVPGTEFRSTTGPDVRVVAQVSGPAGDAGVYMISSDPFLKVDPT